MIVLALLLAYAAAVSDPCVGAPWPSLLVNCAAPASASRLSPPGFDAYMRSEFGVLMVERRPVLSAPPVQFVDPGPAPGSLSDTVEGLGGASCVTLGYGCR